MKYLLLIPLLLLAACKMPGVGELEERVDDLETATVYDDSDLTERVEYVEEEVMVLDQRVSVLESGDPPHWDVTTPDSPGTSSQPPASQQTVPGNPPLQDGVLEVGIMDVIGLQDSLENMKTAVFDSISMNGESIEALTLRMDSLKIENDSLKVQLEELKEEMEDLAGTVESLRYSGTSPGGVSTRGGSTGGSSGGGTGGRGSSSGGSTGGSSGTGTR